MTRLNKLIARFKSLPKDFTWDELIRLLKSLGFQEIQGDGSRVKFFNQDKDCLIQLHKPHPGKILKHYALRAIFQQLIHTKLI